MKKRLFIWLMTLLLLMTGWRMVPHLVRETIPSIYYVTPSARFYENTIHCSGTIQAVRQQKLVAESSLRVGEVYVEIGDRVEEGETLARVEPEAAGAGLMNSLPQGLNLDISVLQNLLASYGMDALLEQSGLVSSDLSGLLEETASVGATAVLPVSAGNGVLTAPISGVVTSLEIASNTVLRTGEAAATIMAPGEYKALVAVEEGDISKIQPGDSAKIRIAAFGGKSYNGIVSKIHPTARKSLGGSTSETVVDVEILLEDRDSGIKPGFSAKAEIAGGNRQSMITVPYEAIRQDENNNEYVYVYENGKLRKQVIITGEEMINDVQILEGLTEASIVIFNPDDVSREGTMIHIKGKANVD